MLHVACFLLVSWVVASDAAKRPGLQLSVSQNGLNMGPAHPGQRQSQSRGRVRLHSPRRHAPTTHADPAPLEEEQAEESTELTPFQLHPLRRHSAGHAAIDQLAGKLIGRRLPDQSGSANIKVGHVNYHVTNIVIRAFHKPNSQVTVTPGFGVTWSAQGAGVSLHGDWRYKAKAFFIPFRDSGTMDVGASGVNLKVSVKMGVHKTGRPTIYTTSCVASIGHLGVKFHGGASWLYNLFDHMIAKKIKNSVQNAICVAAKKAIDVDADRKLSEVKVVTNIGMGFSLDYRLIQAPVFKRGVLQTMHKGECVYTLSPKEFPAEPTPFPPVTSMPQMVYIFASEYVINSLAYAAYKRGLVRFNLSAENIPKSEAGFLNTTCKTECIGKLVPEIGKAYKNSSVIIDIETTEAPYIRVSPKGIDLTFKGDSIFKAKTQKGKVFYLFKITMGLTLSLHAWLDDHTVKAKVVDMKSSLKVVDSKIGKLSDAKLLKLFNLGAAEFATTVLNKMGEKGMVIPHLKGVTYVKPTLRLNQGSLRIGTNIAWKPKDLSFRDFEKKTGWSASNMDDVQTHNSSRIAGRFQTL